MSEKIIAPNVEGMNRLIADFLAKKQFTPSQHHSMFANGYELVCVTDFDEHAVMEKGLALTVILKHGSVIRAVIL